MNVVSLEGLKDPRLVARFQQFFGVFPLNSLSESEREHVKQTRVAFGNFGTSNNQQIKRSKANIESNDSLRPLNHRRERQHKQVSKRKELSTRKTNTQKKEGKPEDEEEEEAEEVVEGRTNEDGDYEDSWSSSSSCSESSTSSGSRAEKCGLYRSNRLEYVIKSKFFYYLFCLGASFGYEIFYGSFFPFWFWNVDGWVGRRLILIWALVMYIGQALKDIIRWKRPASPPVIILEPEYAIEYGMPSTHAMAGFSLPATIFVFTMFRYEYPVWIGFFLSLLWCVLVCSSRLYLGMHSVLDIVAGLSLSAVLLVFLIPFVDFVDHLHLTCSFSPLISFPIVLLMAIYYPKSEHWSPARGDTCVIIGSCFGILTGSWLNYQFGIVSGPGTPPPFPIIWPGKEMIGLCLLRATIGVVVMVAVRAIGKMCSFSILCSLQKLNPKDPKTRLRTSVELPVKLITYIFVGMNITYLSPAVFRFLNIERITMFTEV